MARSDTSDSGMAREAEGLRSLADLLCIWRLCGGRRLPARAGLPRQGASLRQAQFPLTA